VAGSVSIDKRKERFEKVKAFIGQENGHVLGIYCAHEKGHIFELNGGGEFAGLYVLAGRQLDVFRDIQEWIKQGKLTREEIAFEKYEGKIVYL
jgi:hypothetical protein